MSYTQSDIQPSPKELSSSDFSNPKGWIKYSESIGSQAISFLQSSNIPETLKAIRSNNLQNHDSEHFQMQDLAAVRYSQENPGLASDSQNISKNSNGEGVSGINPEEKNQEHVKNMDDLQLISETSSAKSVDSVIESRRQNFSSKVIEQVRNESFLQRERDFYRRPHLNQIPKRSSTVRSLKLKEKRSKQLTEGCYCGIM